MTPEERQELILEVIAKNPKITQNKLLDIVCNQLDGMAKVTFEKTLKKISSNGLVDMENDPHETRNLARDPEHENMLKKHQSLLRKYAAETGDSEAVEILFGVR